MTVPPPPQGRPSSRDTSHLEAHGLDWQPVDDAEHGAGAWAHPPAGGCVAAYESGAWLTLWPGGRRFEGRAKDENAARVAAIGALELAPRRRL